jgi:hypothetical protein
MGPIQPLEAFNATKIELQVLPRMLYTIDVEACINFTSNGLSGCEQAPKWRVRRCHQKYKKSFFPLDCPTKRFRSSQKNRAKKISVHAYSGDVIQCLNVVSRIIGSRGKGEKVF